jgi:hypothetical protein
MKIIDVLSDNGSSTMAPRWDGKVVFAAIFIIGYYALIFRISGTHPVPPQNAQMIRDGMLVLGPAIGVIVGALFRTTGADERSSARRSDELKTAIVTPSAAPAPAPAPEEVRGAVEDGARDGARAGVAQGLDEAADGDAVPGQPGSRYLADGATSIGTAADITGQGSFSPQTVTLPADGGKEVIE